MTQKMNTLSTLGVDGGMDLISTTDAAQALGFSRGHIVKLIREGKLTAYQPGGRAYKLRREDVMAYLESTRVQVDVEEE